MGTASKKRKKSPKPRQQRANGAKTSSRGPKATVHVVGIGRTADGRFSLFRGSLQGPSESGAIDLGVVTAKTEAQAKKRLQLVGRRLVR